ncbi:protein phosphatase 1 regulatory subunit 21 [Phlebotomus argentipes]|uniref:protein phosphatase 1 regulatory subunit 21 n=1 Tax=Phlebotomus argentipes TaxID=94469 RepID=UPI002892F589|nr:protein phosphatase 1 regulatory subunit 21 [Phlebotomus argentipes]
METTDGKYQKLAAEYAKIRAQANVLKRAVLEEQNKNGALRESFRLKEASLRRAEQEVDSLSFRNKQLEHRVASLQDDLDREVKRSKGSSKQPRSEIHAMTKDAVIAEELQKKIIENAQLNSLISDKSAELDLVMERIKTLEHQATEHSDTEKSLRREIDALSIKNAELESKIVDVSSTMGSEDGLSVTGSDHTTPLHTNSSSSEERIAFLEKELNHWRTQYEILKIGDGLIGAKLLDMATKPADMLGKGPSNGEADATTKEQLVYGHLTKKIEELFMAKCRAESKLTSYMAECESLQNALEIINGDVQERVLKQEECQRKLQILEDDMVTTRCNYEEQITVLTEQIINLSDQLAARR